MGSITLYYNGQEQEAGKETLQQIFERQDGFLWLDLTDPLPSDIELLRDPFGFHPLVIEDIVQALERPKIETYPDYYFVIFSVVYHHNGPPQSTHLKKLHLLIGKHYLVTIHRGPLPQIEETRQRWQLPESPPTSEAGAVVYALLDAIVDDYFPALDHITEQIDPLENRIFMQAEGEVTQAIFSLKKRLLRLRRTIAPGRDILNVLLRRERSIFKPGDMPYFQDLYDHVVHITENIDLYRDLLSSALDSNLSFQSNRLNQIVKVLTIASIILMTNSLVAGIYGMNFQMMPELTWPWGYPFALGLMVCLSTGLILFFRHKRWL
ncbi:MAG: magnesium/cobalt transporter CorA [Dehalococcoidia bacterium]|nr:MAG: magnesium/cobalt transporter CorA [Dehalococcoidia bacterium]